MFDKLIHKHLRVPYKLATHVYQSPKRARATVVLLHGLGGSSLMWNKLIRDMPNDVRVIGVDLLGFGASPRPSDVTYNAKTHARSVLYTLRHKGIVRNVLIVGHSLGSLVAVDCARRDWGMIKRLILCSPPFYQPKHVQKRRLGDLDSMLSKLYTEMGKKPERALKVLSFAAKLGIINPGFKVDKSNIDAYIETLNTAIINQSSFADALRLKEPTVMLTGRFDPIVIDANIRELADKNHRISWKKVPGGHEITGKYRKVLRETIISELEEF